MWLAAVLACSAGTPLGAPAEPVVDDPPPPAPAPSTPTCGDLSAVEGDAALQGRPIVRAALAACTAGRHATAGAKGSVLQVHVQADRDVRVSAVDGAGRVLLEETVVAAGSAAGVPLVPLAASGEAMVTVRPAADVASAWAYDVGVSCLEGCDRPFTRYPIVLMHGLSGADTVFGVDYFYRVTETLRDAGVEVESPGVAAFADSAARAAEWSAAIDDVLARGHRRVNLIGHSQGGLDARTLASPVGLDRGAVVASVTTIGTPHRGTPLADTALLFFDGGLVDEAVFDSIVAVYSAILGLQRDDPEFVPSMEQLSEATMAQQDAALLDHPDTWYGSWLGHSCGLLEPVCIDRMDGEIVDPLMSGSYLLLWPRQSDGLVPVDSQSHGVVLGEIPADHADEIGQIGDDRPNPFDHLGFYLAEVDRLEALGF